MTIPPEQGESTRHATPIKTMDTHWQQELESYRAELKREARRQIGADLAARVDESDLVQETMLTAVEKIPQFRGESPREFRGWVHTIFTSSLASTRRRHRSTARRQVDREIPMANHFEPAGPGETPSRMMIQSEQKAAVKLALLSLSERYSLALALRYREGLSFAAVGEQLQISEEAAQKLCKRAIQRLREVMDIKPDDSL